MSLVGDALKIIAETGRLMVGQSSYRAYREHMATHHPGARIMDERADRILQKRRGLLDQGRIT